MIVVRRVLTFGHHPGVQQLVSGLSNCVVCIANTATIVSQIKEVHRRALRMMGDGGLTKYDADRRRRLSSCLDVLDEVSLRGVEVERR